MRGPPWRICGRQSAVAWCQGQTKAGVPAWPVKPARLRAASQPTDVQHVADAVLHMAGLSLSANVQFMTIMASKMPFVGRG
jgi:hypothetical protein